MRLSRRKMLMGLGGVAAGGGALVGTGAFTTVQAARTVEVETAGDGDAFLRLEPTSDPNGQEYASINSGLLEVTIPDVNLNAATRIDNVFQVTNNGTQPVVLYFEEAPGDDNSGGKAIDVVTKRDQLAYDNNSDLDPGDQPTGNGNVEPDLADLSGPGSPNQYAGYGDLGVLLGVGDTLKVGFYIDTSDDNPTDGLSEDGSSSVGADETLMENLIIWADANAADNNNYQFEAV